MIFAKIFVQWLTIGAVLILLSWTVEGRSTDKLKQQKSSSKARKCPENDHYCVLDLPRTASEEQIKKQFRKLAKIYHPDKNRANPDAAEAQFVLISKAYEVLSDEKSRRDYDHELRYGQAPGANPFQRQQHPGHGDPTDDIFRTFQSMFGDDVHQRGPGGGGGGGFSARQQRQQQQQFQRAQYQRRQNFQQANSHYDSQRPNQKVYFTQRGPDGRTYYYEYTTPPGGRPSFTGDAGDDDDFDPFAYMFDAQYRSRHSYSKSFQWHMDFTPTSPWARFVWQVAYYVFFVYAMLSIFACCSGPAPRRPAEPPVARDRPDAREDGDEAQDASRRSAQRAEAPRAAKPSKRPADPAAFPLPVISKKEIVETRGIIFVVSASQEAEVLLRKRRRAFSQDPVLFRRYHRHDAAADAPDAAKKYEEIKMLERLFSPWRSSGQRLGEATPTLSTPSAAATSDADAATAAAAAWRVVAVAKTGGKFAVYNPPASALRLIALASQAPSDEERAKRTQEAEEAVAKGIDEWLSRLLQGLEPWLSTSAPSS